MNFRIDCVPCPRRCGLILLLLLFSSLSFHQTLLAENARPVVIPEIQEWKGDEGCCVLARRIVVDRRFHHELSGMARIFASDLHDLTGYKYKVSFSRHFRDGDIFMTLSEKKTEEENPEKYEMTIGNAVQLTSIAPEGLFWGTRTLLQMLSKDPDSLPRGQMTDWPNYPKRGFMLDVGRKFVPISFLCDYVKLMSCYKMNYFQLHLNDNGFKRHFEDSWDRTPASFRLESETFPGLADLEEHYTKKEFVELQKLAEQYNVTIVPEIDMPAHSLAFTRYRPSLASEKYGPDHLNLFKKETYEFLDSLLCEYLSGDQPIFRGEEVHIGTDEYSNEDPVVVERFRQFTDHYIRLVESYGKKAVAWGALTHADGTSSVKSDEVLLDIWFNGYADPAVMLDKGFDILNVLCSQLYILPLTTLYYHDYLDTRWLYEHWEPYKFDEKEFSRDDRRIKGAMFAIWNDYIGNGITCKDLHNRAFPAIQTLSAKMWTGQNSLPYEQFKQNCSGMIEAPGVNISGRVPTGNDNVAYEAPILFPGMDLPLEEVGFDYEISFEFKASSEHNGTILFQSNNAIFYQRTPENGCLGFYADGYLNEFDYVLPIDKKVSVSIRGTHNRTDLFIDGELYQSLDRKVFKTAGDETVLYQSAVVFPLSRTGDFQGQLTRFKVQYFPQTYFN